MAARIVVDGSNICAIDNTGRFSIERLQSAIAALKSQVPDASIKVFVDASLRYKVSGTEKGELDKLINAGDIVQAPAGIPADDFFLHEANSNGAFVVSNDSFRPYHGQYPWLAATRAGRSVTAMYDSSSKVWTFLERNPGSVPARDLSRLAGEVVIPAATMIPVASPIVSKKYSQSIRRENPTAVVLLVDQSGSMMDKWAATGISKADLVAKIINSVLYNLTLSSKREDGVRDYCHLAVIGYGGSGANSVRSLLEGTDLPTPFLGLGAIDSVKRVEQETAADGRVRYTPIWIEPNASGGTPMRQAIRSAVTALETWISAHPDAFPPVVINVTDGESSDGDIDSEARDLCGLETSDGNVLLFTAHISSSSDQQILYPADLPTNLDDFARSMFSVTSILPPPLLAAAKGLQLPAVERSRGFIFNASRDELTSMLNFGTPVTTIAQDR